MKKLVVFLILFSSFFIFSDNVLASHNNYGTLNINTDNVKLEYFFHSIDEFNEKYQNGTISSSIYNKYINLLNQMITDSGSSDLNDFKANYDYFISISNDFNSLSKGFHGAWFSKNNDVIYKIYISATNGGSSLNFTFTTSSLSNSNILHRYWFHFNGDIYETNSLGSTELFTTSGDIAFSGSSYVSRTGSGSNGKTSINSIPSNLLNKYYYVDTNIEQNFIYTYYSNSDYFQYLTFNNDTNNIYQNNDIISGRYKWICDQKYTFEDTIHVGADQNSLGISKIIFDFKIPENLNVGDYYDFTLDIEADGQASDEYTPKPFLNYGSEYGDEFINQVIDVFDSYSEYTDLNGLETYANYTNEFGIDMEYRSQNDYIRMIIDFGSINYNGDYYLKFESTLDYEVSYITKDDEYSYWTYIDMHNKYGLYLIPKVLNNDLYITIDLLGEYQTYFLENYTNSESRVINYGMKDKTFTKIYNFINYNQALKFINTQYDKNENDEHYIDDEYWYIKLDNRYFNYVVLDTPYNNEEIINPNTDEKTTTGNIDDIINTSENYEISTDDFFAIINQANKNNGIAGIINQVYTTIRKNYKLGTYFLIIIVSCIIILILKSLKR